MPTQQIIPAQINPNFREKLAASRIYYVRTGGSDSNNGLSDTDGGAWKTLQHAADVIYGTLDLGGNDVTVYVRSGTYTDGLTISSPQVGAGTIKFSGDVATPANVTISMSSGACIAVSNKSVVTVEGIKVTNSNGSGYSLTTGGVVLVSGLIEWGACSTQGVNAQSGGQFIMEGDDGIISGNRASQWRATQLGLISVFGSHFVINGSPNWATAFAQCLQASIIVTSAATYSGTATGKRYDVTLNGVINTGGGGQGFLPGNASGTFATGGQYA